MAKIYFRAYETKCKCKHTIRSPKGSNYKTKPEKANTKAPSNQVEKRLFQHHFFSTLHTKNTLLEQLRKSHNYRLEIIINSKYITKSLNQATMKSEATLTSNVVKTRVLVNCEGSRQSDFGGSTIRVCLHLNDKDL